MLTHINFVNTNLVEVHIHTQCNIKTYDFTVTNIWWYQGNAPIHKVANCPWIVDQLGRDIVVIIHYPVYIGQCKTLVVSVLVCMLLQQPMCNTNDSVQFNVYICLCFTQMSVVSLYRDLLSPIVLRGAAPLPWLSYRFTCLQTPRLTSAPQDGRYYGIDPVDLGHGRASIKPEHGTETLLEVQVMTMQPNVSNDIPSINYPIHVTLHRNMGSALYDEYSCYSLIPNLETSIEHCDDFLPIWPTLLNDVINPICLTSTTRKDYRHGFLVLYISLYREISHVGAAPLPCPPRKFTCLHIECLVLTMHNEWPDGRGAYKVEHRKTYTVQDTVSLLMVISIMSQLSESIDAMYTTSYANCNSDTALYNAVGQFSDNMWYITLGSYEIYTRYLTNPCYYSLPKRIIKRSIIVSHCYVATLKLTRQTCFDIFDCFDRWPIDLYKIIIRNEIHYDEIYLFILMIINVYTDKHETLSILYNKYNENNVYLLYIFMLYYICEIYNLYFPRYCQYDKSILGLTKDTKTTKPA